MRAIFATQPGSGHFEPLLPLARALRAAGHEVSFATTPPFVAEVEAAGFPCAAVGPDFHLASVGDRVPQIAALEGLERTRMAYREIFLGSVGRELAVDLLQLCRTAPPDLIVWESSCFGAGAVADALGVPSVSVAISTISTDLDWMDEFRDGLNGIRAALQLPSQAAMETAYGSALLSSAPRELYGGGRLPAVFTEIGMESYDAATPAPDWVFDLPRRPTVYVTMGTNQNKRPEVFRAVVGGLAGADLNVVVTTGADQDPAVVGPPPDNARIERFIPQAALLPRCAAVICHGGSGSIRGALWFGLPLLLMPFAADQPRNAEICSGLGLALVLNPATATPAEVQSAVARLLTESQFRHSAEALSRRMRSLPDLRAAVERLSALVG